MVLFKDSKDQACATARVDEICAAGRLQCKVNGAQCWHGRKSLHLLSTLCIPPLLEHRLTQLFSQALLIGLMFLKNPVVYIQFHPVVYMVKLNIEMSMASLIVQLAQGKPQNDMDPEAFKSSTDPHSHSRPGHYNRSQNPQRDQVLSIQLSPRTKKGDFTMSSKGLDENMGGIERRTDLNVVVEQLNHPGAGSRRSSSGVAHSMFDDEIPLHGDDKRVK